MKKLRNFKCESKTKAIIERFVVDVITIVLCDCGCEANKTISTPRYLGNSAGGKSPARR